MGIAGDEPNEGVVCPKCGHVQPEGVECSRCGLIISKYYQARFAEDPVTPRVIFYDPARQRSKILRLSFLVLVLVVLVYWTWTTRVIKYPPGVLVRSEPLQVMISNPKTWMKGTRQFVPLARFSLKARVLSSERYTMDYFADIGPIDLALGWGPMSDQAVIDQLDFLQGSRRLMIVPKKQTPPLPWQLINATSANVHVLPADRMIKKKLLSVQTGDLIVLKGYLVGVRENGQWTLFSSLSRTDSGDGACEIVWVEEFETVKSDAAN